LRQQEADRLRQQEVDRLRQQEADRLRQQQEVDRLKTTLTSEQITQKNKIIRKLDEKKREYEKFKKNVGKQYLLGEIRDLEDELKKFK